MAFIGVTLEQSYAKIAAVVTKYTFTYPVELADCEFLRNELLVALPGYGVEVYHKWTDVTCNIWSPEKVRVYSRLLLVKR